MAKELADFRQGDTKRIRIDYGLGFDITGYEFFFTLKARFEDTVNVAQVKTIAGNHPADDAANGIAIIELPSDVSKLIPVGKYFYDIQRVIPGNPPDVLTILPSKENYKDKIEILPDVTQEVA